MSARGEQESESESSSISSSIASPRPSQHKTNFYYLLVVGLGFGLIQVKQFFDGNIPSTSLNSIHLVVLVLLFITTLTLLWRNRLSPALEKGLFYVLLVDYTILNHLSLLMTTKAANVLLIETIREDIWLLLALCVFITMIFTKQHWRTVVSVLILVYSASSVVIWGVVHNLIPEMVWLWQLYAITALLMLCIFILSRHQDSLIQSVLELQQMRKLANTDVLTNIANRRRITEVLQLECERAKRYQNALAVVMWDIDAFKKVNDVHGHSIGDEVLKMATEHIASQLREVDLLGRWGGEEFVCILPETRLEEAVLLAERLRSSLANLNQNHLPQITASFGVTAMTTIQELQDDAIKLGQNLIDKADQELYKAKELGRNQVSPKPNS